MRNNNFSRTSIFTAGTLTVGIHFALLILSPFCGFSATVEVSPGAGGRGIQQALDKVGIGGQVVLQPGIYLVDQPIILRQNRQRLCGAGEGTILFLADNANCPVVILGPPKDKAKGPTEGLDVCHLLVDGNRTHQQKELWRVLPSGARINNNGVHVCNVVDATIEEIICRHCRSGGLVSTGQTRRLTVRNFTAYDNQFDGLACYRTEDSHFSQLDLRDNLAAGISLDLEFDHNVIVGAVLTDNDLGIFMRNSRDNVFEGVTIRHSRHDGVFMAQVGEPALFGWRLYPGTQCTGNEFDDIRIVECGGRAFQVNDSSCTNNTIHDGHFLDNARGGLSQPPSKPVTAIDLIVSRHPTEHSKQVP